MADVRRLVWTLDTQGGDKIKKAMTDVNKSMDAVSKKMGKAGKSLLKGVTVPLIGIGTAGTKMAMEMGTGLRKVMTLADSTILPIDNLRTSITDLSLKTGMAQTELLEGAYDALSSGVETADVMDFVKSSVDLTMAGFTDMSTAIDATTTVLNAYGDKAFEVSKIHDIFVQTQDLGKITVDQLGKSIGRVIPTASSLGVNLDQLGAGYSILTAKGQNAMLSTTNLNAMFSELGATGSKVDKALKGSMGKGFAQLTADGYSVGDVLEIVEEQANISGLTLKDMFGSMNAGAAAVTLLSDGAEGYNKVLQSMHDSQGKTAKNAETMKDDAFRLKVGLNAIKVGMIEIGRVLTPIVADIAEKIAAVIAKFNGLDDSQKELIVKIGLVVAAIGPLLIVGSKVLKVVSKIPAIMSGVGKALSFIISPAGLVIGSILAIIGVLIYLYKTNEDARNRMNKAWGSIKETFELLSKAFGIFMEENRADLEKMGEVFKTVIGGIGGFIAERLLSVVDAVGRAFSLVNNLINGNWREAWEDAKGIVMDFITFFTGFPRMIHGILSELAPGAMAVVDRVSQFSVAGFGTKVGEKVTGKKDGSHRTGKSNIPYDGYMAETHKGEEILSVSDPRNSKNKGMGGIRGGMQNVSFSPNITINGSQLNEREQRRAIEKALDSAMDIFLRKLQMAWGV